jgi:hypothetical protein
MVIAGCVFTPRTTITVMRPSMTGPVTTVSDPQDVVPAIGTLVFLPRLVVSLPAKE